MQEKISARVMGSLFLAFGLGLLLVTYAGLRLAGLFSPMAFILGAWLTAVAIYQIATNVSSMTPAEQVPKWWVPGIVVLSLLVMGGTVGLLLTFAR